MWGDHGPSFPGSLPTPPFFFWIHEKERKKWLTVVSCRRATRIHGRPLCFHSMFFKRKNVEEGKLRLKKTNRIWWAKAASDRLPNDKIISFCGLSSRFEFFFVLFFECWDILDIWIFQCWMLNVRWFDVLRFSLKWDIFAKFSTELYPWKNVVITKVPGLSL